MKPDPVIDEIRRIRHEISAEHGHDPARLVEYYRELQSEHADRMLREPSSVRAEEEAATHGATKEPARP